MTLEKYVTANDYTVVIGVDRFKEIMRTDGDNGYKNTLYRRLECIEGIDRIEYDGHFGPNIFIRVEVDYDTPETWEAIEAEINA